MTRRFSLAFLILVCSAMPLLADGGANHQVAQSGAIQLGTSGGNVNDITKRFCCSGTLGALVTKGGTGYILSNAHVLSRNGQAAAGEDISQPGLIDNGCRIPRIVADFSQAAPLGSSNVDAALAEVRAGDVDPLGTIIDVGIPAATTATPTVGRGVAKSGRTTGLTCGSIGATNATIRVQYQLNCGQGKKFFITYTNQVVISSSSFSAGGDSGSLIVTSDTAEPVALLFAGSSTTTIGNPIQDVTNALGVIFVGGGAHPVTDCPASIAGGLTTPGNSQAAHEHAASVKEAHAKDLMADDAVQGVGVGTDENGDAVVVVFVEEGRPVDVPAFLNGVRTRVVRTDTIRAF